VEARVNIVISGATGSGKTTLLNVASSFIPMRERIVTIEDTAELQFAQAHVVRLEARPPDVAEKGEITIRQLLINVLRMRPDRIIVGEARGAEALDMLQAMNTGHDGSLTTVHSNSPRDTLRRIELMTLTSGVELGARSLRDMIAAAIELIVHVDRLRDGSRKVVQVTEVNGIEGDVISMTDLFVLDQSAASKGQFGGVLRATGLVPRFEHKFARNNIPFPKNLFTVSAL
jgi:pilus assembly protein CpaF